MKCEETEQVLQTVLMAYPVHLQQQGEGEGEGEGEFKEAFF